MRKRKKNNAFTSALGEELTTRKVLEKAKDNEENRILMAAMDEDFKAEIIAEPVDSTRTIPQYDDAPVIPVSQSKKAKAKKSSAKSADKKISDKKNFSAKKILPVKLEAENDFEKRIFAEAENDFYDEKIPQHIGKNMRSGITEKLADGDEKKSSQNAFRSKFVQKKFEEINTENLAEDDEDSPDFNPELHRKLSRAETAGVGLSAIMMIYAFENLDKPLFFLALSLFIHLMRPLIGSFFGKNNRAVQNAMRSFSWVLFFGALVFLFMLT